MAKNVCLRRLHRGQFIWPQADAASWQISAEQWRWLVAGVDWQRLSAGARLDLHCQVS
ncbi:MAG: IS66 family insertion sequence element accessory protein TnpB [Janthinobacterium svalbardensis]|uniref:IS66 family insertion sequence element accessory protein TnpB n=1 Tax=Janthinobacterium svalbardensis TaxID=368607 RepID=UPI001ABFF608|nr:IS66 family insertion sequence element accessory protein TnpB [Janthinobacterium svalbardensis]